MGAAGVDEGRKGGGRWQNEGDGDDERQSQNVMFVAYLISPYKYRNGASEANFFITLLTCFSGKWSERMR